MIKNCSAGNEPFALQFRVKPQQDAFHTHLRENNGAIREFVNVELVVLGMFSDLVQSCVFLWFQSFDLAS